MIEARIDNTFESWRDAARKLLATSVAPADVLWSDAGEATLGFGERALPTAAASSPPRVPPAFLSTCRLAACHRDPARWALMYRVLWRLGHGEPHLLDVTVDPDVYRLLALHKAVSRDRHKMTAFVRFRRVEDAGGERYVAWHRPDHRIVRLTAPFFAERFAAMRWAILTPHESVAWDGDALSFGPGVARRDAPAPDDLEGLWKTYYGNIFNPARVSVKAMRAEMPVRHWDTLPEAEIIPDLLRQAPRRVEAMAERSRADSARPSVAAALPPRGMSLPQLRSSAAACQGCDLYCHATQTVFGEGPADATLAIIGEQPGDEEDLAGRPFVGPAGRLLDEAFAELGIDRHAAYVTNVVKHFKWEPRGTRRIHKTPSAREVAACEPWLAAEMAALQPRAVLCLGATAARAVFGRDFQLTRERGVVRASRFAPRTIATWHPSALLRIPDPAKLAAARRQFRVDLAIVAQVIAKTG